MLDPLVNDGLVSGRQLKMYLILVRCQCKQGELNSCIVTNTNYASGWVPEYAVCYSAGCASILMKKSDVASFDEVKAVVCIGQMSKSAIYFVAMKAIHPENIQHSLNSLPSFQQRLFGNNVPGLPCEGSISWGPPKIAHTISTPTPKPHRFPQA